MREKLYFALWLLLLLTPGCGEAREAGSQGLGVVVSDGTAVLRSSARDRLSADHPTFLQWKAACDRLPSNRSLRGLPPPRDLLPLASFQLFEEALGAFFELARTGPLRSAESWVGAGPDPEDFFNTQAAYFAAPAIPFQPFAQKLIIPPGAQALFHGDLHGDIHSLITWLHWLNQNQYLRGFKIVQPETYMIFLGDYTDRGSYGIEVLYTVLRLKLENPDHVFLLRGNHEDVLLASRYGFLMEGQAKYGRAFRAKEVMRLYDFLPVVLYVGCQGDFLQCNHGGMEPGYDPRSLLASPGPNRFQLLGRLGQRQFLSRGGVWVEPFEPAKDLIEKTFLDFVPQAPTAPTLLGFMWNDFTVVKEQPQLALDPDRGFVYGDRATRFLLESSSSRANRIRAVFRAHQHSSVLNPMMRRLKASRGVFRHWQETDGLEWLNAGPSGLARVIEHSEVRTIPLFSVWTFNVSPDSLYGEGCDFDFDAFGILTTQERFEDWRLTVVNLKMAPRP